MAKFTNTMRSIGVTLAIVLGLSGGFTSSMKEITKVNAFSSYLEEAQARVSHIKTSLHKNYLGLKNQGTWEGYIREVREVFKKIPASQESQVDKLVTEVDKAEKLVTALSRINQVEKSMEVNALRIGNVPQWQNYLALGIQDLEKVDKVEFSAEIEELENRENICKEKVNQIEENYSKEASVVSSLLDKANKTRNKEDVYAALAKAEKLGSCEITDMLKYECKLLLNDIGEVLLTSDEKYLRKAYEELNDILDSDGIDVENTEVSTICLTLERMLSTDVKVSAVKLIENPEKGEELFNITLSKGNAKLYPIGILFK